MIIIRRDPRRLLLLKAGTNLSPAQLAQWRPPTRKETQTGEYNKPRISWHGLTIRVENPAGSIRDWGGGQTRMVYDYGYVEGTEGTDGDEVDIILGPDLETVTDVYIVHQRRKGGDGAQFWRRYDEDKVMAGFKSEDDARVAYLRHYDDPRFLGPVTVMPIDEFVQKVRATADKPAMIKSLMLTHVGASMRAGHSVKPYDRRVEHMDPQRVRELRQLREERAKPREDLRAQFHAAGDGFELAHGNGQTWAVLLPDASNQGKYRYQVFDAAGLHGHYTYNTPDEALDGAFDAGFRSPDPGAMENLAPQWAEKFANPDKQAATTKSGERADSDRTR